MSVRLITKNNKPYSMQEVTSIKKDNCTEPAPALACEEVSAEYFFEEVSAEELMKLRLNKTPEVGGVVWKTGGKLYYTAVPADFRLSSQHQINHLCGCDCTKISTCPRVRDLTVPYEQRYGMDFVPAVYASWRVEKYDFIREGIEAFNMESSGDAFLVSVCADYAVRERKSKSSRPTVEQKLSLASLYWEDFNGDRTEMKARINKAIHQGRTGGHN